jgi:uncharacterized MnhB-related membrane protein
MLSVNLLPDIVLGILLLLMAWGALFAPTRRDAMAMFIAFGVVIALIWARLDAPDLALAEAAIGAGLTGTLFLFAARRLPEDDNNGDMLSVPLTAIAFTALTSLLFVLTVLITPVSILSAAHESPVFAQMDNSGVSHPVTAVLLNFRAWDTLLELLVLLLALTGLRQLFAAEQQNISTVPAWPLLLAWTRLLAPLLIVTGGYLLWSGSAAPGGAFQSGAMLAAAGVMLRICGLLPPLRWSSALVRSMVAGGAVVFVLVAILTLLLGDGWLVFPVAHAGSLILLIELFATLSIAITLLLLVAGEREDLRE